MPFVGELLQVRDDERDWEGVAERLLRNFGLSLIVPDAHYVQVAAWVDSTHLAGRLVYFRVRPNTRSDLPELHRDALARKLLIKQDSPFYDWLERELARRFDMACCATAEQFRRETRAITRAGQTKAGDERHEKDDRHRLDDRSRFVLGWQNADKIAALQASATKLEAQLGELGSRISHIQSAQKTLKQRLDALSKLDEYTDFNELDWQSLAVSIAQLMDEQHQLESTSNVLKQLVAQLSQLVGTLKGTEIALDEHKAERAKIEQKQQDVQILQAQMQAIVDESAYAQAAASFPQLDAVYAEVVGVHQLTVESCDNRQSDLRDWLQKQIDNESKKLTGLGERIVKAMTSYNEAYKLETAEIDASIAAAAEYKAMLVGLQSDDLPRFEARFKELLNENTIREVANFHSQLARERETIKDRIAHINESLTQIDYNTGRYIVLEAQPTPDADIRDFQTELRICTEGAMTGSEDAQYSEAKFLQVQRIIERFRGREGQSEQDKRWSAKVTDVRNWFVFAASERCRE
ncbi:MAG: ATP-dependent exonuclease SbcCD, C subunit-like protein, partial [Sulfuriferula sp.]